MRALRPLDSNEKLLPAIAAILALITVALHVLKVTGGGMPWLP
jgi:hypothetical protein